MARTVPLLRPPPAHAASRWHPAVLRGAAVPAAAALVWFGLSDLAAPARLAVAVFAAAGCAWAFTALEVTYVGLAAVLALVATGVLPAETAFGALGEGVVWLLVASFVLAAAVTASGLSDRLLAAVAAHARSVGRLFYLLTGAMLALSLVIPSTSGRAALMVPLFLAVARAVPDPRVVRALALLIPTVVLLSSAASLVGCGANAVAAQAIARMTGEGIGYLRWLLLGLPFALASCYGSAWVILRLFLRPEERRAPLSLAATAGPDAAPRGPLRPAERWVLGAVFATSLLWATEAAHGLPPAAVALFGALVATAPGRGPVGLKQALKDVDWNLILFLAAGMAIAEALVRTGAAGWMMGGLFALPAGGAPGAAASVAAAGLLAHLVLSSRTARVAVLVPVVVAGAAGAGLNPAAAGFLAAVAAGYCLTLPVSAKPVALFAGLDAPTYTAADLLRLSAALLPLHLALLLAFAWLVWPRLGLPPIAP